MKIQTLHLFELACILALLTYIPVGPWVVMWQGVRLDILLAGLTLVVGLRHITSLAEYPRALKIGLLLFLVATLPSVLLAPDVTHSAFRWLVIAGYAGIAFLSPFAIYKHITGIRYFMLAAATATAVVLLFLKLQYALDPNYIGRLSFATDGLGKNALLVGGNYVDPNHTAIGLAMCITFYLPNFRLTPTLDTLRHLKYLFEIVGSALVLVALIALLSRTALLSFMLAVIIPAIIALTLQMKGYPRYWPLKPATLVIIITLTLIGTQLFAKTELPNLAGRSFAAASIFHGGDSTDSDADWPNVGADASVFERASQSHTYRIDIIKHSLNRFSDTFEHLVFGTGFFTTNPHNEYLRYLTSSGIIGALAFTGFTAALFWVVILAYSHPTYRLQQISLAIFLFTSIQFYGHTKTFWIPVMFLLANYLSAKHQVANDANKHLTSPEKCGKR